MHIKVSEDKENKHQNADELQVMNPLNLKVELTTRNNNTIDTDANQSEASATVTDLDVVVKEETKPSVVDLNLPFTVGDIVWAHINGYPLWPSIITEDPLENLYTKTGSKIS